jgi:hypothetical protein
MHLCVKVTLAIASATCCHYQSMHRTRLQAAHADRAPKVPSPAAAARPHSSYNSVRHHALFDLSNGLGWIEALRADCSRGAQRDDGGSCGCSDAKSGIQVQYILHRQQLQQQQLGSASASMQGRCCLHCPISVSLAVWQEDAASSIKKSLTVAAVANRPAPPEPAGRKANTMWQVGATTCQQSWVDCVSANPRAVLAVSTVQPCSRPVSHTLGEAGTHLKGSPTSQMRSPPAPSRLSTIQR